MVIFTLLFLVFALDRLIKYFILNYAQEGVFFLIPKLLGVGLHKNYGVGLGLPLNRELIIILSVIFIALFCVALVKIKKTKNKFAILLIVVGAIGNLVDRIFYGFVTDYISLFSVSFLNLSDLLIFLGIILLIFSH